MNFRRPLGLALSGGGALGSWQTAAMDALERAGLSFDAVIGFSAGALNASYYFLSKTEEALERWRRADGALIRPAPKLRPFSLFSNRPIWEAMDGIDDHRAKAKGRCRLVVISAPADRSRPVYAKFEPNGGHAWDGPLVEHVVASCSIPIAFPPVRLNFRGRDHTLIDGGIPCAEPVSFRELGPCKDVIVLEMIRADEPQRRWGPYAAFNSKVRLTTRWVMNQGVTSLTTLPDAPRVFRLAPSRHLDFAMLDFRRKNTGPSLELGAQDAKTFLNKPEDYLT